MKQTSIFISSCLVFILTLILFKVVSYGLVAVLFFYLSSVVVKKIWDFRKSSFLWTIIITPVLSLILSSIAGITVYSLFFLPVEFLTTEIYFKITEFPSYVSVTVLTILIILFNFVNWRKIIKTKKIAGLMLLAIFFSGLTYFKYRKEKLSREYLPKIYNVVPLQGIQGEFIKIKGVNFGPVWKNGEVFVGKDKMVVRDWSDQQIIFEQSVPSRFGKTELKVFRKDGWVSNQIPFQIRNPDTLNIIN